jgi:hypothetical protein
MRQNQFGQTPDRVADLAGHGDLSALLRDSILIKKK